MQRLLIAPSILSADFAKLADEINEVTMAGADVIHVDVMDGNFVPNITIGQCVVESLKKICKIPLDVHLMISDPEKYADSFLKAGSDWLTFHVEATNNSAKIIEKIKSFCSKAGISVKPGTPIETISPFLKDLDLVLVMSVEPGFGGQKFMPQSLEKIKFLRENEKFSGYVSIDGGINSETAVIAVKAGVDMLVAGSSIFHTKDRFLAIKNLRKAANS